MLQGRAGGDKRIPVAVNREDDLHRLPQMSAYNWRKQNNAVITRLDGKSKAAGIS